MMLPGEHDRLLKEAIEKINTEAQALGLRPYPVVYDIVPDEIMFELASYIVPGRFSHWSHGREYERNKTLQQYGHQSLYETVLNTNICQAYLLDRNTLAQNKMIVAHVVGHSDFFANNGFFAGSPARMDRTMNLHAERIRMFEERYGILEVETLLDAILSIDEYVDPHSADHPQEENYQVQLPKAPPKSPYDDLLDDDDQDDWLARRRKLQNSPVRPHTPNVPDHDLIRFIINHSPILKDWERDVMSMIRQESLYFAPNRRTKISNEGWATLIHTIIMRRLNLSVQEHLDFGKMSAGVTARHIRYKRDEYGRLVKVSETLNPYHLGYNIFDYLNRKYGGSDDTLAPELLKIREYVSDTSLVRDYLDESLVKQLFGQDAMVTPTPEFEGDERKYWEVVRDSITTSLYNSGSPEIVAVDGDHLKHRGLYLRHIWSGQMLDVTFAEKTLEHIYRLWGRKVYLETKLAEDGEEIDIVMSYSPRKGHESKVLEHDD